MPGAMTGASTGHAAVSGTLTASGALLAHLNSISLSWTAPIDPVDGYNVYRGPSQGAESTVPINSSLILATSYTDGGPQPGQNWYYVTSSLGGVQSVITNELGFVLINANSTGHAAVTGTLRALVLTLASNITGHSVVSGSVSKVHITGHSVVSGTLTAKGALAGSSAGHGVVSGIIKAKGVLVGSSTGHSVVSGPGTSIGVVIIGHSVVVGHISAASATVGAAHGHSVVSGIIAASGKLSSSIQGHSVIFASVSAAHSAGHSVVSGVIKGIGTEVSSITGHSVVSGQTFNLGILISPITGHSVVSAVGRSALGIINGHATVSGHLAAKSATVASSTGHSVVHGTLGSVALQGLQGRSVVVGTLSGSLGNISCAIRGSCVVNGGVLSGLNLAIPLRNFGCSIHRPALVISNSRSVQIFPESFNQVFNKHFNQPVVGTPDGFGIPGHTVMPGQLLVAPGSGMFSGKPQTVTASGTFSTSIRSSFTVFLFQNYFAYSGGKAVLVNSVPLLTVPGGSFTLAGGTLGWSFSFVLPSNIGLIQLSVGVQFSSPMVIAAPFQAQMFEFSLR
jgi:hypothetical protein